MVRDAYQEGPQSSGSLSPEDAKEGHVQAPFAGLILTSVEILY